MCASQNFGETGTVQYPGQNLVLQLLRHPSPLEFEVAYPARAPIEKIIFAIEETEQIAGLSNQGQEIRLQLLHALDRLESIERRCQVPDRVSEKGQQLNSRRNAGNPESLG